MMNEFEKLFDIVEVEEVDMDEVEERRAVRTLLEQEGIYDAYNEMKSVDNFD